MDYRKLSIEGRGGNIGPEYIVERSPGKRFYLAKQMVDVPMNDGKYSQEGLSTRGLNGCIALISRTQKGKSHHGIMTHYDPTKTDANLTKIEELLAIYSNELVDGNTKTVLFHPKIGNSVDELAQRVKSGFERLVGKKESVKMVPYPIESEHVLFTGTEGILKFDVSTGRYDFQPFTEREGYNPDLHGFL